MQKCLEGDQDLKSHLESPQKFHTFSTGSPPAPREKESLTPVQGLQYWQAEKTNKGLNISHVNAHAAAFNHLILGSPTSASGNPRRIAWEELGHLRESKGFSDSMKTGRGENLLN